MSKERRRSNRQNILDSFNLFVSIPKKGGHRLRVQDLSLHGVGFDLDTEGEIEQDFPVKEGEILEIQLFLNRSLNIPLTVEVKRLMNQGGVRFVGTEVKKETNKAYEAFQTFVNLVKALSLVDQPE